MINSWRLLGLPWLHPYIHRYTNMSGNKTGWQAVQCSRGSSVRLSATAAASHRPGSSYLWRSLALAAWGIATTPRFDDPNPTWTRNWRPPRNNP
jgi:hypothetical protein